MLFLIVMMIEGALIGGLTTYFGVGWFDDEGKLSMSGGLITISLVLFFGIITILIFKHLNLF